MPTLKLKGTLQEIRKNSLIIDGYEFKLSEHVRAYGGRFPINSVVYIQVDKETITFYDDGTKTEYKDIGEVASYVGKDDIRTASVFPLRDSSIIWQNHLDRATEIVTLFGGKYKTVDDLTREIVRVTDVLYQSTMIKMSGGDPLERFDS
jgi:hypothetical protein